MSTQTQTQLIGAVQEAEQIIELLRGEGNSEDVAEMLGTIGEQCWQDIRRARASLLHFSFPGLEGMILAGKGSQRWGND